MFKCTENLKERYQNNGKNFVFGKNEKSNVNCQGCFPSHKETQYGSFPNHIRSLLVGGGVRGEIVVVVQPALVGAAVERQAKASVAEEYKIESKMTHKIPESRAVTSECCIWPLFLMEPAKSQNKCQISEKYAK